MSRRTRNVVSWIPAFIALGITACLLIYIKSSNNKDRQEALLMNVLEATNTMVIKVNKESSIKEVSGKRLLGYKDSELEGMKLSKLMFDQSIALFHDGKVREALNGDGHRVVMAVCLLKDKDGSSIPISLRVFVDVDAKVAIALVNKLSDTSIKGAVSSL